MKHYGQRFPFFSVLLAIFISDSERICLLREAREVEISVMKIVYPLG